MFSLLLPGLGHLYAGQPRLAVQRWLITAGVAAAGGLAFVFVPYFLVGPVGFFTSGIVYVWVAVDASKVAALAGEEYQLRRYNRWYVYLVVILMFGVTWEVIVASRYEAYRIPSGAMEPTVLIGDFIFVSTGQRSVDAIGYGSIVAFESREDPRLTVLKRVVAIGGDTVQMTSNVLYRNGDPMAEPYVQFLDDVTDPQDPQMAWQMPYVLGSVALSSYRPTLKNWGPLLVPPDSMFVLGDNRDRSYDSRYYGFIGRDQMVGRASRIYYSYDREGILPLPFLTAIRWNRIGKRL